MVAGLDPDTPYDFTLMSYRIENGAWAGATYSNLAVGQSGWIRHRRRLRTRCRAW
jgi:hypothetical protein